MAAYIKYRPTLPTIVVHLNRAPFDWAPFDWVLSCVDLYFESRFTNEPNRRTRGLPTEFFSSHTQKKTQHTILWKLIKGLLVGGLLVGGLLVRGLLVRGLLLMADSLGSTWMRRNC